MENGHLLVQMPREFWVIQSKNCVLKMPVAVLIASTLTMWKGSGPNTKNYLRRAKPTTFSTDSAKRTVTGFGCTNAQSRRMKRTESDMHTGSHRISTNE